MAVFEQMAEIVPEGECGVAKVVHKQVSKEDRFYDGLRSSGRYIPIREGKLCTLLVKGRLMMSDGPNEHGSNREIVRRANGDVLIAGLGLGMVLIPILRKPEVRSVLVLEKYPEVTELVGGSICDAVPEAADKLKVVNVDVFEYNPPKAKLWDCIYFDIWPDICTDNLEEISKLKRKFARRLNRENPSSWMGAWYEDDLRYQKRRENREEKLYQSYASAFRGCKTFG